MFKLLTPINFNLVHQLFLDPLSFEPFVTTTRRLQSIDVVLCTLPLTKNDLYAFLIGSKTMQE